MANSERKSKTAAPLWQPWRMISECLLITLLSSWMLTMCVVYRGGACQTTSASHDNDGAAHGRLSSIEPSLPYPHSTFAVDGRSTMPASKLKVGTLESF